MSEFVSLDGVIQDPDGNEGFRVGGWVGQLKDREERYAASSARRWTPRPYCSVGAAMSSSPRGGNPGVATWRTG